MSAGEDGATTWRLWGTTGGGFKGMQKAEEGSRIGWLGRVRAPREILPCVRMTGIANMNQGPRRARLVPPLCESEDCQSNPQKLTRRVTAAVACGRRAGAPSPCVDYASRQVSSSRATHASNYPCGDRDTDFFLEKVTLHHSAADGLLTDLRMYCGSTIFDHLCLGTSVAAADALCADMQSNAALQAAIQTTSDSDSDAFLFLLFLLLLLPALAIPIGIWAYRSRRQDMPDREALLNYYGEAQSVGLPGPQPSPVWPVHLGPVASDLEPTPQQSSLRRFARRLRMTAGEPQDLPTATLSMAPDRDYRGMGFWSDRLWW